MALPECTRCKIHPLTGGGTCDKQTSPAMASRFAGGIDAPCVATG